MSFDDVKAKTAITGFTDAQRDSLLADMQTAYDTSAIAKAMFDDWLATKGHTINISYVADVYQGYYSTGKVELDPGYIKDLSYISDHGKAVLHTQLGALVHELGHALTGKLDNYDLATDYFTGDNVKYVNTIWQQLGLPLEVSYVAQAWNMGTVGKAGIDLHRTNYDYTNGTVIDGAITSDRALISTGKTTDLLIGGPSANTLQSGDGDDYLDGEGGNDELNGGDGKDTAIYFGSPTDYDIRQNKDSTWTVRHARGAKNEGTDTLKNVEQVQFGKDHYELKKEGLTFQTDFALVIDTTGSMTSSIASVQAEATALVDALFASGKIDARIGVVSFKDAEIGEPTDVVLPFTDQDVFADRKAAAVAAINSITVGGGGDLPETAFDGMLKALDGTMGEWRPGAGTHRIALFTDAEAKDGYLAGLVLAYALNIGATIKASSTATGPSGSVDTFELAMPVGEAGAASLALPGDGDPLPTFTPHDDPVVPDTTMARLEIYTIFTGPSGLDTQSFDSISSSSGGALLTASSDTDLVAALLDIVSGLTLVGTPGADTLTGDIHIDKLTGLAGDDILDGGANADSMNGGPGNDTYFVDNAKDTVTELAGEGNDTVMTTLASYALPANVETVIASNDTGVTFDGNALANSLTGGKGGDRLQGFAGNDVLMGGDGDDVLYGGMTVLGTGSGHLVRGVGAGNDTIATALDISSLFSLDPDADILDATTVPHVSIEGHGDGSVNFYSVTLNNIGDVLTLDVDHTGGAGGDIDTFLVLYAADSSLLASADESSILSGAGGSTSFSDPFLQYTTKSAGTFYIAMGRYWGPANLETGDTYELQVSVAGEALAGTFASGNDTLFGGKGSDALWGGDGQDTFEGTLAELSGDRIADYEANDRIVVQGATFGAAAVSWTKGSTILRIDANLDGTTDAAITLNVAPDDLLAAGMHLSVLPAGGGADTSIAFAAPAVVSIATTAAVQAEGNAGTTDHVFTLTLSTAAAATEAVSWSVAGAGANPASALDFSGGALPSGTVTFAAGETSKTLVVGIAGDMALEADEGFSVSLSNPSSGLTLGTASATATILNDDVAAVVPHGDAYILLQGQSLVVNASAGVLLNDPNASTAALLGGPTHGTLMLAGDGSVSYTPAAGFFGIDAFTYRAGNASSSADEQALLYVVPVSTGATTTLNLLALDAEEQIAATYVAFFGRAADAPGFAFWVDQFNTGLATQGPATLFANIASSFGVSAEAKALYPFLAHPFGASAGEIGAFLDSVYDNLFNRSSDAAGLAYWTGQIQQTLAAGQFVGSVLINIISGAQDSPVGKDITTLMAKVAVGLEYVRQQEQHHTTWAGASDIAAATALLDPVGANPPTVLVGIRDADDLIAAHA